MIWIKCYKSLILHIVTVFIYFPISLKKFDEMIEPFRLHESRDSARAEARRKEQPFKITDEELSTFEEKVKWSKNCIFLFVGLELLIYAAVSQTNLQIRLNELLRANSSMANLIFV